MTKCWGKTPAGTSDHVLSQSLIYTQEFRVYADALLFYKTVNCFFSVILKYSILQISIKTALVNQLP
jgi:hypothetical protein